MWSWGGNENENSFIVDGWLDEIIIRLDVVDSQRIKISRIIDAVVMWDPILEREFHFVNASG